MILVSACLAGLKCKYDGGSNSNEIVMDLVKKGLAITVCPEQLGGLPTPRDPAEIRGDRVYTDQGVEVTEQFKRGAAETLKLAKLAECSQVILKQRSPSCGFGMIYDGSHTGTIISGNGITAGLLADNGIRIISEEQL